MKSIFCLFCFVYASLLVADSLWKDDVSFAPAADKKARLIGDILNVRVQESNTSNRSGTTSSSRSSSADANISQLFFSVGSPTNGSGLFQHKGAFPAMKFANSTSHAGSGSINNTDSITTRFAVRVVDVLPNRNMIIEGIRRSAYSGETQTIILRGTVRADDIAADNSVYSYQIADMNIRYLSSGVVTGAQDKGWFMKFWDTISPF